MEVIYFTPNSFALLDEEGERSSTETAAEWSQ